MRILLINHFPLEGSGSGIYTRNLAEGLVELGNEVMVIFPEQEKTTYPAFESKNILFKNDLLDKDVDIQEDYDMDINFPCFTSHPRSNNTYYDLSDEQIDKYVDLFIKYTKDAIATFRPDIIHCPHLWITPYVASLFDIPYYITAHGTDLKGYKKDTRYHKYAHIGAKGAKGIITISKQVDQEVREIFNNDNIITHIILNGYNPNLFRIQDVNKNDLFTKWNITRKKHTVFFAGKLAHFKGVDTLLDSAKLYEEKLNYDVVTVIAGNGDQKDFLLKKCKELNLKNIFFLGHVYQEDLVDFYNIADVSTVPSRKEPFGLVAIEALACGIPVIGTNQGGLVDFINQDVGALVPVEDPIELAYAIEKELTNPDKDKKAKYCAKYAKDNFSREISINKVFDLYK